MRLNDVRGVGACVEVDWTAFMARACPIVDCWSIFLLLVAHLVIVVRAWGVCLLKKFVVAAADAVLLFAMVGCCCRRLPTGVTYWLFLICIGYFFDLM